MTTTEELDIEEVYTSEQITRLAALQGVAEFAHGLFGTVKASALIELAEYVIGDDEPFDPVAEAHKAMAALRSERGYDYNGYDGSIDGYNCCDDPGPGAHEDGPLADWERELLTIAAEERVVGDITVSDLDGFLALPLTAILEDDEGDIWRHDDEGWGWGGSARYTARSIFTTLGGWNFIVTNPEVLA